MKILVVEDEAVSRHLLNRHLARLGHEVAHAADGRQAWEMIGREHFPVVISDWLMPEMDGLELCRRIRAREAEPYTYVVLLTALEGKERYLEGIAAGADDFLTKPFDEEVLAARLHVAARILALQAQNRRLARLLPICAYCRKVRDDRDYWRALEEYLASETDTKLSHGICPDCMERVVEPELRRFEARRAPRKAGA